MNAIRWDGIILRIFFSRPAAICILAGPQMDVGFPLILSMKNIAAPMLLIFPKIFYDNPKTSQSKLKGERK